MTEVRSPARRVKPADSPHPHFPLRALPPRGLTRCRQSGPTSLSVCSGRCATCGGVFSEQECDLDFIGLSGQDKKTLACLPCERRGLRSSRWAGAGVAARPRRLGGSYGPHGPNLTAQGSICPVFLRHRSVPLPAVRARPEFVPRVHAKPPAARPRQPTLLLGNGKGVALEFLGGACCALVILADIWNRPGVTPTMRLKWWVN
jgi:hypothetical protein